MERGRRYPAGGNIGVPLVGIVAAAAGLTDVIVTPHAGEAVGGWIRRIDLHCYPGTAPWIESQGPYVEALATYWKRPWVAKDETAVADEVEALGIEAVLVAFDIESVTHTPPCSNGYVAELRDRYPKRS